MLRQLEAECDRQRQFAFVAALRSPAVHGPLVMDEPEAALDALAAGGPEPAL